MAFARTLDSRTVTALVIGGVIGSGIFMKPAQMAAGLGSAWLLLVVWVAAGLITLCGALTNAELAALFPETGGQYVFFKEIYGNAFAFVYGWASFAVFNTAGNASIAYVCSQYINYFAHLPRLSAQTEQYLSIHIPGVGTLFPLENIGLKLLTIFIVLVLTWINYRGLKEGGALQRTLTALKAVAIILLILGLMFSEKGSFSHLNITADSVPRGIDGIGAFMAAMAGAFWAFDGWNNITFVAGEIKEPQRTIPHSLFWGLGFCIVVYVLINLAFIYIIPVTGLAQSSFVASDVAELAWGSVGGLIIAFMVILSTLGAANANVLATARVTFAMGNAHSWFARAGEENKKFGTPGNALVYNAVWSSILVMSGSFDMLTDMLIFVSWFFYGMSALGVILLRYRKKELHRPYKVWGYPWVPMAFVFFVVFFLTTTLINDIAGYRSGTKELINSVFGIIIVLPGLIIYNLRGTKS